MLGHSIEHSIPHNVAIRQANLSNNLESQVNVTVSKPFGSDSTQQQALELYKLGFNVFPQPHGKKAGLPWKQLQYTRLHATHPVAGVTALFQGKYNIAVMCGRTSSNLFVIDCETTEVLNYHTQELRRRQIPLWIVESARGGHIYLQCSDGEVANIESGIMRDAELRGCRGYVLAAGSIHPTGAVYRWLRREGDKPPQVSAKAIDWFTDKNGKPLHLKVNGGRDKTFMPYNPFSRATQEYLASGDNIAQGSRNNRLFSAACDMAGNGCDQSEIEQKLSAVAERSGLDRSEVYATIRSALSRDRKPARPQRQPAKKQPELWKYALAFAESQNWQGRTGTSDKIVFLALIERAKTASSENGIFRASTREISVLSRTSINTTQKSLKRLQDAKYIFYAGQDKMSQASLWRFPNTIIKEGQTKAESFTASPPWISFSDSVVNSTDVLERGALGYIGLSVYRALLSECRPMMPSALAALMKMPVHRINYALKKLLSFRLVFRDSNGWRAVEVGDNELDEAVARPAGKLGRGVARRQKYAAQRALYVGQIILRAQVEMFGAQFLAHQYELEQMYKLDSCSNSDSSVIVEECNRYDEASLKLWKCPNCGQVHFAEVPPDMCDFCRDFTTWKPLEDADAEALSDPLVLLALELGAEVYMIEDGKRRLIASRRSKPPE